MTLSEVERATAPTPTPTSAPTPTSTPTPDTARASSAAPGRVDPARSPWVRVCALEDLEVERGRAALLGGTQVALFLTHGGRVHAVSNFDPYSDANVMSRGIVGSRQEAPTVASPMYKQVFDLRTGLCLDTQGKEPKALRVWPVAVRDGDVCVREEAP